MQNNVMLAYRLLYYTYGILPIVVGLDKFFGFIAYWDMYLNPMIPLSIHMSPQVLMYAVGIIEIIAGGLVLWRPDIGGRIVSLWLVIVALNLFSIRDVYEGQAFILTYYDVGFRDIAMAIGAYVMVLLYQQLHENENRL